MHFAAWLSVGDRSQIPPATTATTSSARCRCSRRWSARSVPPLRVLVDRARCSATRSRRRSPRRIPTQPINAYGETKLAIERALPHYERAYGIRSIALRYFNAAGADPDGELGEDHAPEIHVIPRAIDAALGRGTFQIFGDDYDTPDGTCLRDYIHVTDLAVAHLLALDALRSGALARRPTTSATAGRRRSATSSTSVERVDRHARCRTRSAPRRAGDPGGALRVERAHPRASSAGRRSSRTSTSIVETAWRWRDAHPHGYATEAQRLDVATERAARRSAAVGRDARLQRAGRRSKRSSGACSRCRSASS